MPTRVRKSTSQGTHFMIRCCVTRNVYNWKRASTEANVCCWDCRSGHRTPTWLTYTKTGCSQYQYIAQTIPIHLWTTTLNNLQNQFRSVSHGFLHTLIRLFVRENSLPIAVCVRTFTLQHGPLTRSHQPSCWESHSNVETNFSNDQSAGNLFPW
jgi:hypothetical protein